MTKISAFVVIVVALANTAKSDNYVARDVVIGDGGRIFASGQNKTTNEVVLIRFAPDGSYLGRDEVPIDSAAINIAGHSLDLDSSGRILVSGKVAIQEPTEVMNYVFVMRFLKNGGLDQSFGEVGGMPRKGWVKARVKKDGVFWESLGRGMKVDPNDRSVVAGYARPGDSGPFHLFLMRFDINGDPDNAFGVDGQILEYTNGINDGATAVDLQLLSDSDYGIVAAGWGKNPTADIYVSRYFKSASGFTLKASPVFDLGGHDQAQGMAYDNVVGRWAVAGFSQINGGLDVAFLLGGVAIESPFDKQKYRSAGMDVAFHGDGACVLTGFSSKTNVVNGDNRFFIARYDADGKLNSTGTNPLTIDIHENNQAFAIAISPVNQDVVIAGRTTAEGSTRMAFASFNKAGEHKQSWIYPPLEGDLEKHKQSWIYPPFGRVLSDDD